MNNNNFESSAEQRFLLAEEIKLLGDIDALTKEISVLKRKQKETEIKIKRNLRVTTNNYLVGELNYLQKQEHKLYSTIKGNNKRLRKIRDKIVRKDNPRDASKRERVIQWTNVRFLDGAILFELSRGHFSSSFGCKISRRSYNFLKKYFIYKNLPPLKVMFDGERPVSIQNIEALSAVFEILEIENYIYFDYFDKSGRRIKLLNLGLSKKSICSIYNLYSKSIFFEHLIKVHNDKFKIIPIPEVILNDKYEIIKTEDSFVFAYQKSSTVYLIWESIIEKKATYLFKSSPEKYGTDIQRLFDYICSPDIKNKRESLIRSSEIQLSLNFLSRVMHSDPSYWITYLTYP